MLNTRNAETEVGSGGKMRNTRLRKVWLLHEDGVVGGKAFAMLAGQAQ